MNKIIVFVWLVLGCAGAVKAQQHTAAVKELLVNKLNRLPAHIKRPAEVKSFYIASGYTMAWLGNDSAMAHLWKLINNAPAWGLQLTWYTPGLLQKGRRLATTSDSVDADIEITGAAIQFFGDIAYGSAPEVGYNGLSYKPSYANIPLLLWAAAPTGQLNMLLRQIEPACPEYNAFKTEIAKCLQDTMARCKPGNWQALVKGISTVRWLYGLRQQNRAVIVVNIPSATLLVYNAKEVLLSSKVIVGKMSTHTPLLCSQVTEVVLYPYWMVPATIATRELLPMIKRNPGYIDANGFQVLSGNGKILNPYSIDWSVLSAGNFPYVLRQSTGCDNSLGLVKLNFYSPYDVYLHDTPWKKLFAFDKRFFSHGCIRVEKAIELGRFVLDDNAMAIDTLTEKGCLYHQRPINVPVKEKIPVCVLYNTAWVDAAARVRFYKDVYKRF